jgi:PTS system beta-glucosides-specific IIC component
MTGAVMITGAAGQLGYELQRTVPPGIAVLPVFFKEGHMPQFLGFLLSISVAFILGALFTWLVGFKDEPDVVANKKGQVEAQRTAQAEMN